MAKIIVPSQEQENIYSFVRDSAANILVEAVAGSGKTTTQNGCIPEIRYKSQSAILQLAFNKAIAEEQKDIIKRNGWRGVKSMTFSAMGLSILMRMYPASKLDSRKVQKIAERITPKYNLSQQDAICAIRLVNNHKQTLLPPESIIMQYDIFPEGDMEIFCDACDEILQTSNEEMATHDFNDMVYIPLLYAEKIQTYDHVMVDEAQDLSPARRLFAAMLLSSRGRFYAFGDRHQSIYAYQGADFNSMDLIKELFSCTELPLHTSFRVPRKIADFAQQFCPHIKSSEDAEDGEVLDINEHEKQIAEIRMQGFEGKAMLLCRYNAPVLKLAWDIFKGGGEPHVLGRDMYSKLGKLLKACGGDAEKWKDQQLDFMIKNNIHGQQGNIIDTYKSMLRLRTIAEETGKSPDDVVYALSKGEGLIVSTIHKAKGLETNSVAIFGWHDMMPSEYAKQDWELEQERNLQYVAVTRARHSLYLLNSQYRIEGQ